MAVGLAVLALRVQATEPLIRLTPGQGSIDRGGTPVNRSLGGILRRLDQPPIAMTTIGAGLRKEKVSFVTARVYVAQLLVDTSTAHKFVKTAAGALDSTDGISTVAMYLTFDRDLNPMQLSDGLREALAKNRSSPK